jgi:hypothetical protein
MGDDMKNFVFNLIHWKETFQVNLVRSGLAGFVWFFLAIIMSIFDPKSGPGVSGALVVLFSLPIVYFLFFLPLGIAASFLSKFIPIIWMISWLPAVIIWPADPFVYLLHKLKPKVVPIEEYRFIEFSPFILVYNYEIPNRIKNKSKEILSEITGKYASSD